MKTDTVIILENDEERNMLCSVIRDHYRYQKEHQMCSDDVWAGFCEKLEKAATPHYTIGTHRDKVIQNGN